MFENDYRYEVSCERAVMETGSGEMHWTEIARTDCSDYISMGQLMMVESFVYGMRATMTVWSNGSPTGLRVSLKSAGLMNQR